YDLILSNPATPFEVYLETDTESKQLQSKLVDVKKAIARIEAALSIKDNADLTRLMKNQYVALCVNALGVKERLRDKLRSRKFELDSVERTLRKQLNNNQKINEHTEASVKRRDPSISQLTSTYNKLCDRLGELLKAGKAPHGAVLPQKIEAKGLFALDVDDAIWQDVGLGIDGADQTPPLWLSNNAVRTGIQALLEYERCLEEDIRLRWEFQNMKTWFFDEWQVLSTALVNAETDGIKYCLNLRQQELLQLCVKWDHSTQSLFDDMLKSLPWGPTSEELQTAYLSQRSQRVSEEDSDLDDEISEADEVDLFETLDTLDLVDAFRAPEVDTVLFEDID
ncbi:hypothetical protein H0H92_007097, partial [Tricholoma furcatifolium]